jgi:hypothetical protein
MNRGIYLNGCCSPEGGTPVNHLKVLDIACQGSGKVLAVNIPRALSTLLAYFSKLTFHRASSMSSGGAISAEKGAVIIEHCVFGDIQSLASSLVTALRL